jgi:hypothetical protein
MRYLFFDPKRMAAADPREVRPAVGVGKIPFAARKRTGDIREGISFKLSLTDAIGWTYYLGQRLGATLPVLSRMLWICGTRDAICIRRPYERTSNVATDSLKPDGLIVALCDLIRCISLSEAFVS